MPKHVFILVFEHNHLVLDFYSNEHFFGIYATEKDPLPYLWVQVDGYTFPTDVIGRGLQILYICSPAMRLVECMSRKMSTRNMVVRRPLVAEAHDSIYASRIHI